MSQSNRVQLKFCHSLLRPFKIMSQSNMSTLKMSHSSVSICKSVTVYRVHFGKCHSLSCPSKKMSQSILSTLKSVTVYCVHMKKMSQSDLVPPIIWTILQWFMDLHCWLMTTQWLNSDSNYLIFIKNQVFIYQDWY